MITPKVPPILHSLSDTALDFPSRIYAFKSPLIFVSLMDSLFDSFSIQYSYACTDIYIYISLQLCFWFRVNLYSLLQPLQVMEADGVPAPKEGMLLRLRCSVKNYDWGRIGRESCVARLYSRNTGEEVREDTPYAEFWMGTHDSGPAYVVGASRGSAVNGLPNGGGRDKQSLTLKDWIQRNPTVLGDKVVQTWGADLPFLFKVASFSLSNFQIDSLLYF